MKLFSLFILAFTLQSTAMAKTFVYCSEGSPSAFNPQITTDGTSNNAAAHTIYNRLIEFKYGSTELEPGLATSWEVSKDGKQITFNLRNDVNFHATKYFTPSRKFNADDVLFSFNRQLDKSHPFHQINGGSYQYWEGMDMSNLVKSIEKLSDHQVKITLTKAEAPFLANMAMSFMSIISKEYGDQLLAKGTPEKIDHYPVGTGPFIFKKYVKDSLIRYTANKSYFGGKPNIDRLVFSITPDANVRYQKLKTNECHLIIEPDPSDIASMKTNDKLIVLETSGLNVSYLAMNTSKAPFNNPLVRKAINHALNRDSYIKAIYRGNAIKAKNPLPPNIWGYDTKAAEYEYDITKAKALLEKADLKDGFEVELWTLPVSRPYNPAGKKMGEMMQADLAKVGIKVKLVSYDWPTYLSKSRNGEHQLIQLGWTGDNGDPDNFLHILLGCDGVKAGSNVARWCDEKFNSLITKAKRITEQQKRSELYIKAQRIFNEAAPWAPIAHSKVFRTLSKKVTGYKIDPLGGDIFTEVDIQ